MLDRITLLLWRSWLRLRGAQLAPGARVNPSVHAAAASLTLGAHARLYWGGDVLAHGGGGLVGGAINFGAVAGRQNSRFGLLRNALGQVTTQALQGGDQFVHGEGKPTAQIQRCSGVVQA